MKRNTLEEDTEAIRALGPEISHLPIRIKPTMRELFEEYRQMREEQEQSNKEESK